MHCLSLVLKRASVVRMELGRNDAALASDGPLMFWP